MKKERVDFFFELFEKGSIPNLFSKVYYAKSEKFLSNPNYIESNISAFNKIYSIFFIPDYIKPVLNNTFDIKRISQFFKGYAIFLNDFPNADAYIKYRFKKNSKTIKKRVRRLESCFKINYKTFYGTIDTVEYDSLMNSLYKMLVRRFEQRNDISQSLLQWKRFQKMFLPLINEKKASLFVIYEGNIPIAISLSHHFHGKLFSAISSYDIDYAKFSLGSVEIYKKLDWCIANDHDVYEMGMGDLSYKREWCNHIYNFEHQIIFPKKSISASMSARLEYTKVKLKEFLYRIAYVRYKKIKTILKKDKNNTLQYKTSPVEEIKPHKEYLKVDYNTETYSFLRKIVYDFLYSAIENVTDVEVLEISKESKSYLVKGKLKMQKIVFDLN